MYTTIPEAVEVTERPWFIKLTTRSIPNVGTLWIECNCCGKTRAVASGCVAFTMTTMQALAAAKCLGWEIAPRLRCDGCVKYNQRELNPFRKGQANANIRQSNTAAAN